VVITTYSCKGDHWIHSGSLSFTTVSTGNALRNTWNFATTNPRSSRALKPSGALHYVTGLQSKILTVLLKDGYKFKEIKTLAKWQKAAEMAVAKFKKKAGQESTAEKTSVRPPLQKLKEITVWNQMKKLSKNDRKKIIEELAIKFLEGEQLVAVIRKLDVDLMYISKKKSLQLPLSIVTYQGKQKDIALIDSGATNNFIDF
jgi:hypothetical protein